MKIKPDYNTVLTTLSDETCKQRLSLRVQDTPGCKPGNSGVRLSKPLLEVKPKKKKGNSCNVANNPSLHRKCVCVCMSVCACTKTTRTLDYNRREPPFLSNEEQKYEQH